MSRKSRNRTQTRRDASAVANRPWRLLASLDPIRSGRSLTEIEDRRQFSPGVVRPARTLRQVARVLMRPPSRSRSKSRKSIVSLGPEVHAFRLPQSTAICVRRSIRKQVLHAQGAAGNPVRRPHRNQWSKVSCRRSKR